MAYIISVAILPPLYTDLEESKFSTLLIIQILDTMHKNMKKKNNTLPQNKYILTMFKKIKKNLERCPDMNMLLTLISY